MTRKYTNILEAYRVLSNTERRNIYDKTLRTKKRKNTDLSEEKESNDPSNTKFAKSYPVFFAAASSFRKSDRFSIIAQAQVSSSSLIAAIANVSAIEEINNILINQKSCIHDIDKFGNNALHIAIMIQCSDAYRQELIRLLKKAGCSICRKNGFGLTPIQLIAKFGPDKITLLELFEESDIVQKDTQQQCLARFAT